MKICHSSWSTHPSSGGTNNAYSSSWILQTFLLLEYIRFVCFIILSMNCLSKQQNMYFSPKHDLFPTLNHYPLAQMLLNAWRYASHCATLIFPSKLLALLELASKTLSVKHDNIYSHSQHVSDERKENKKICMFEKCD